MTLRRIERWMDGQYRPACEEEPQLASAKKRWSGFLVERDPCRQGSAAIAYEHTELVLVKSGGVMIEDHSSRGRRRFAGGPGTINVWPAGHESRWLVWTPLGDPGPTEMVSVQLHRDVLALLLPGSADITFAMQPALHDAILTSLVSRIETEVQTGCATGRLYGEYLCMALLARLRSRQGTAKPARSDGPLPTLSLSVHERMREYVQAHLDADLCLDELARVAQLSPQHFAMAFKASFGTTPHRYVLRQRIEHAKQALADTSMSIADLAFSLGFATQSHFTAVFRRMVGVTPGRYRATL
jgi:AraC family transcriptional regulator